MPNKTTSFSWHDYNIQLTYKNNKHLYLRIKKDGSISITAPFGTDETLIRSFLASHQQQITQAVTNRHAQQLALQAPPTSAYLWGQPYTLAYADGSDQPIVTDHTHTITLPASAKGDANAITTHLDRLYHKAITTRLPILAPPWEVRFGITNICYRLRKMTTRWGSINTQTHRLTLNTALAQWPEDYLTYVLVHELCHLTEVGHNPRFYALLAHHIPNWQAYRQGLRQGQPPPD